jgi:ADP-glucose pyrophosphorylase
MAGSTKKVLGMILAGGEGNRLYPLTRQRAKPAIPFGEKYRLIDFALSNFINRSVHPECNLYNKNWPIRTASYGTPPGKFIFNEDGRRGQAIDRIIAEGSIISGEEH